MKPAQGDFASANRIHFRIKQLSKELQLLKVKSQLYSPQNMLKGEFFYINVPQMFKFDIVEQ